jgi:apolipoprotein N-acyltransferase
MGIFFTSMECAVLPAPGLGDASRAKAPKPAIIVSVILSAALLALCLPNELFPGGFFPAAFFCLAPYFAALRRTGSPGEAALSGFLFGFFSHALSSYWLAFFREYAVWTMGLTSVVYGLFHLLTAQFIRRFSRAEGPFERALRPVLLAMVWTFWEYVKSSGFFGYPWGLVAYGASNCLPLLQIADVTGVYGLSFLFALVSALVAEAADCLPGRRTFSPGAFRPVLPGLIMAALLLLWTLCYGGYRLSRPTPVRGRVSLLLVQHNANSWIEGELPSLERAVRLSREGLAAGPGPSLMVWSETVLIRPFQEYAEFFQENPPADPLIPFLREAGIPLLTGAPELLDFDTWALTNSAILIEGGRRAGAVRYSYAKQHMVPFAEFVPGGELAPVRAFMKEVVGLEGGWIPGRKPVVMTLPGAVNQGAGETAGTPAGTLRFGVPICFEDAFAPLCARFFREGADILINLTNDSWSRTVSAETQHLFAARFRSIENRRVLVRSTNGGITAVIDAEGRIGASLPPFTETFLSTEVAIQKGGAPTVYAVLGDWLPLLCAAVLLLRLLGIPRTRRRPVGF